MRDLGYIVSYKKVLTLGSPFFTSHSASFGIVINEDVQVEENEFLERIIVKFKNDAYFTLFFTVSREP